MTATTSQDRPRPADPAADNAAGNAALALAVALGALTGLSLFTFVYAEGPSYLGSAPEVCTNCHVMEDYYDSWQAAGHGHVAVCNDCHLPPDLLGKYWVKADNGLFHSLAFTFDTFGTRILIKPRNRRVTQRACLHCHQDMVHPMQPGAPAGERLLCIHCHADAGHGPR